MHLYTVPGDRMDLRETDDGGRAALAPVDTSVFARWLVSAAAFR
jgi:hypothetical protein